MAQNALIRSVVERIAADKRGGKKSNPRLPAIKALRAALGSEDDEALDRALKNYHALVASEEEE